jgi:hypothetical protein
MHFEIQATEWEVKEQEIKKLQSGIEYYKDETKKAI